MAPFYLTLVTVPFCTFARQLALCAFFSRVLLLSPFQQKKEEEKRELQDWFNYLDALGMLLRSTSN